MVDLKWSKWIPSVAGQFSDASSDKIKWEEHSHFCDTWSEEHNHKQTSDKIKLRDIL